MDLAESREARGPFNTWVKDRLRQSKRLKNDGVPDNDIDDDDVWYQFIRGQLSSYQGDDPEDTYETVRMEGSRAPQAGHVQADVHIYEVYWADLSRLKAGIFSIFTELYQFLFHLPSLGVLTVNAAALHHRTAAWSILRKLQTYAAGILTVPIPILNLFMLGMTAIVVALTAVRNANAELALLVGALTMVVFLVLGRSLWNSLSGQQIKTLIWISPLLLVIGIIILIGFNFAKLQQEWEWPLQIVAACIVAVIVVLLLFFVLRIYDRRRPGALKWAVIIGLLMFIGGVISIHFQPPDPDHRRQVIMFWVRQFEVNDIALLLSWAMFFGLGLGSAITGAFAVTRSHRTELAQRSWWTGQLMLSLPALALLIVTVGGWYLITDNIPPLLPDANYSGLWAARFGVRCVNDIPRILQQHLGIVFKTLLFGAVASVVFATWGLAPVVWREIFPPKSKRGRKDSSKRLGQWLTLGFSGLLVSGVILYAATMFLLPIVSVFALVWRFDFVSTSFAAVTGTAVAGLFLVRGRLKKLALGFRPVLEMLLDVDNWFREHPRESNPKARICGRYVSLLRYISNWRKDPADENSGYSGIVIIAHSQGTVITADLLRFLNTESRGKLRDYDPGLMRLTEIPILFFTMGCPLRQLYGLRFPHLYHWARHDDRSVMNCWKHGDIPESQLPDPRDLLGVRLWVNCYRSGDYVGRFLWRTDSCEYLWTADCCGHPPECATKYNSTDGVRRLEFCIGAGAHTHYWDRTAGIVAKELDRLISTLATD